MKNEQEEENKEGNRERKSGPLDVWYACVPE